ncbi:cytoplasmic tRNA 2-thiolation protein 2 [Acarospora aff. strigata]|nr:cytoplasmic tRNA 2-thiolation protein 2 [Acarospora aff. strigata]
MRYIRSKPLKRLESYRVKGDPKDNQRTLLLPVSCGVSSVTLLHILDQQLLGQLERTGRTGYSLHVLLVDTSTEEADAATVEQLDIIRGRYPQLTYTVLVLSKVFSYGINFANTLSQSLPDDNVPASLPLLTNEERLHELLSSVPSATSRSDVLGILRTRLIVEFAKAQGCETVLWGDSTTRLAEKTLAETAKGRGFSLPWQTAEGASPYGVHFSYPLRDLLKKELLTYSELTSPPLTPLIMKQRPSPPVSASARNTTIDALMSQYFESVELNYPSIVANVVRTSSKLRVPRNWRDEQECGLCGLPIEPDFGGIDGWAGDQQEETASSKAGDTDMLTTSGLCYGCARTMHGAKATGRTLPIS